MTKYKKLPVIIEAVQWTGKNDFELIDFIPQEHRRLEIYDTAYEAGVGPPKISGVFIKTLEGEMKATMGDYIIKGVNGEFYPCKEDIFNKTYEELKEE